MPRICSGLACRRAAVSLIFATALIPIMMLLGLAIDFGFYNEAQSQLNMAADAAAMHAARVAAQLQQQNDPDYETKGQAAGLQWFAVQEGLVPQIQAGAVNPQVQVNYIQQTNQISVQVSYTGVVQTQFAGFFPASWPNYPNWGIAGGATAVISIPAYTEVQMLLDNSSSMLIAATDTDIQKMESITPCSQQAGNTTDHQTIEGSYSWVYNPTQSAGQYYNPYSFYSTTPAPNAALDKNNLPVFIPYGYGTFYYTTLPPAQVVSVKDLVPPAGAAIGQCDQRFINSGAPINECLYPPSMLVAPGASTPTPIVDSTGKCLAANGGGAGSMLAAPGTVIPKGASALPNMPQAPCAFACHDDLTAGGTNDFYALAVANGVNLRYEVLQQAAAEVITSMQQSPNANSLSVSVYQFNAPGTANSQAQGIQQVYPQPSDGSWYSSTEAGQDWATANSLTANVLPPRSKNVPDTDLENAMTLLGAQVAPAGTGTQPTAPRKNLFIVTDGMDDYLSANDSTNPNNVHANTYGRVQWGIDSDVCNKFKNSVADGGLGYTVYVLYVQYLPLPNPYYLDTTASLAEPTTGSTIYNALQSCASTSSVTGQPLFYVADGSASSINTALQTMLAAAIGTSGRYSQ